MARVIFWTSQPIACETRYPNNQLPALLGGQPSHQFSSSACAIQTRLSSAMYAERQGAVTSSAGATGSGWRPMDTWVLR
jgi:hypothetical protein